MTKTIFKTLLSLLILFSIFSISCGGNDITGGGDGGGIGGGGGGSGIIPSLPPDNNLPPETDTESAKDFLKDTFNKYSKGQVIEFGNETYNFDSSANMTLNNGITYNFWGMAPDNNQTAYYYYNSVSVEPQFMQVYQDEYTNIRKTDISSSEIIDKMKSTIFNIDPIKTEIDYKTVKQRQNTSSLATSWKNQIKDKAASMGGTINASGDVIINIGGGQTMTYYFWGATNKNGNLNGLYYFDPNDPDYDGYYPVVFKLSKSDSLHYQQTSYGGDLGLIIHPKKDAPDNTDIKPSQPNTPKAQEWKSKIKNQTYKAWYQSDSNATYTFDASGTVLTLNYKYQPYGNNGQPVGNPIPTNERFTFWGAVETNQYGNQQQLYGFYYNRQDYYDGSSYYNSLAITFYDYSGSGSKTFSSQQIGYGGDLGLIMHPPKDSPDNTGIKTPQPDTQKSRDWKTKIKNKNFNTSYMSDDNASYTFDANGNLTLKYKTTYYSNGQQIPTTTNEKFTFWGAVETNYYGSPDLFGFYYNYTVWTNYEYPSGGGTPTEKRTTNYQSLALYIEGAGSVIIGDLTEDELTDLMFEKKIGYAYDNPKTSTTTTPNNNWIAKVKDNNGGSGFKEQYTTIYNFEGGGNILVKGGKNNDNFRYQLQSVQNNITNAVYKKSVNLRDMFGIVAPNSSITEYYGITFNTTDNKFNVYSASDDYQRRFDNWKQSSFDRDGKPHNNKVWENMPLQSPYDIDWNSFNPKVKDGDLIQ